MTILLSILLACHSPDENADWTWGDLRCEYDPHEWYDTPTFTALHTEHGAFDFDPPDGTVERRVGTMDLVAGTFDWDETFAEGYPFVALHAEGTGTISDDGDLSVSYTTSTRDVLDQVLASEVTVDRDACTETWTLFESGEGGEATAETTATIVSATEVEGTTVRSESDADVALTYTDHDDQSTEYTMDYAVGDWHFSGDGTDEGDGTGVRDWTGYDDEYDYAGHFDFLFDGSRDHDYLVTQDGEPVARVTYHQTYAGDATGTWDYYLPDEKRWLECTYAFDDDSCFIECPKETPLPC